MSALNKTERAIGAIMGAFVGDALALGPHWYYDLAAMRAQYGEWISDYTTPAAGRYHEGLHAGDLSQAGRILKLLVDSLVARQQYDEDDFCTRLEQELFSQLDGSPMQGPGGYTNQSMREAWTQRVKLQRPWTETGGSADTTEAIERTLALAVRYAGQPAKIAETVAANTVLTQTDSTVVSMTVAYASVLGMLVEGHPLDARISEKLMALVKQGALPFHAVTSNNLQPPSVGTSEAPRSGNFASPDALLTPSYMAMAANDPDIRIEPAWKVSLVYGMPCAIYHQLPAAYYLAARFADDFESAVLHAVNGGGQNVARAMLTGALVGAQVGVVGIAKRLLQGLRQGPALLAQATLLAKQMDGNQEHQSG